MLKSVMTFFLAGTIFLGWMAFTGDQPAANQVVNQRTDAHLRGYGPYPPAGPGYAVGHYPRPYPYRYYAPVRWHHPRPVLLRSELSCPEAVPGPLALWTSGAPTLSLSSRILANNE